MIMFTTNILEKVWKVKMCSEAGCMAAVSIGKGTCGKRCRLS
jgi:hypothetical protein